MSNFILVDEYKKPGEKYDSNMDRILINLDHAYRINFTQNRWIDIYFTHGGPLRVKRTHDIMNALGYGRLIDTLEWDDNEET